MTCRQVVFVWGSEPPAWSIGYDEPLAPHDSGFSVLFDDAPDPEEVEGIVDREELAEAGVTLVCIHCLIEDHPEIGRGLDVARRFGAADLDEDGEWVAADPNR